MAATFLIPGALRGLAGDRSEVRVDGAAATLGEAFGLLWGDCPGVRDRVLDERGEVRPHVNVFVDGEDIRYAGGLGARLRGGAEILILPAVSGG
ncbi:MAG: ubiquitin-like small modifier protein 1 [Longimicrobiaceae bacterium]